MGKYEELSRKALEALGGVENITHVTHCATRLRISYARKSVVNEEGLKDLPGSAGIVNKDKQIQIIIGPGVHDAYEEFLKSPDGEKAAPSPQRKRKKPDRRTRCTT